MPDTHIYWLHALSPTHAGIGRGVGYIDLPIDRDGVTGWPIIRGSAFKGVWADHHRATKEAREANTDEGRWLKAAFGVAGDDNNSNAGALIVTDAQLVCLPIRSFRGTFAWCTSPLCLRLLRRSLELARVTELPAVPTIRADNTAHHATGTALKEGARIFLEDLDFDAADCPAATAWAAKLAAWVFPTDAVWQEQFKKRFCVLPDVAFDFLSETGTEVHTRVRIDDDTKTVVGGALWTEESLPAETILAGLIRCDRVFSKDGKDVEVAGAKLDADTLLKKFATNDPRKPLVLQVGGKATIGRGQMRCVFTPVIGGGQ